MEVSTGAVPIPGDAQTVAELIELRATSDPHREALVDSRRRLSFDELETETRRWANALTALGLVPGDRIAASMANSVDLVLSFLAAMRAGLVWVGISWALTPVERDGLLVDSGASVLLVAGSVDPGPSTIVDVTADGWLHAPDPATALPTVDPLAPAAIAYTSGTTGRPKGVVHSQRNMILPGVVARSRGDGDGRIGMYLPLTSLNMQVLGPVYALVNAQCCVCIERSDVGSVVAAVAAEKIERLSAAAATVYDLVEGETRVADLASLHAVTVGGSATPDWLVDAYVDKFGRRFLSGYGLTEAPSSVTRERADQPHRAGSSGPALPQFELVVVDDDGRPITVGEIGEICFRAATTGPFAHVYTPMLGYWNRVGGAGHDDLHDVQAVADEWAFVDEWVRTGDIGRLDRDGELYVVDRRTDLIVRGGTNVYPAEVERVLLADERIAQCAVVARPDSRLGQVPVVFVQPRPGATVSAAEVLLRCRSSLATFKVPVEVFLVEDLPRNAMGKILRHTLRAALSPSPTELPDLP